MTQISLSSANSRFAALLLLLFATSSAGAIGLGDLVLESRLGQPLRAHIPLIRSGRDQIDSTCLRHKLPAAGDQLPRLAGVQLALENTNGQPRIVVNSGKPANDVALLLGVQVGCGYGLERDYTVLLDPPESAPTGTPLVEPVAAEGHAPEYLVTHSQAQAGGAEPGEIAWQVGEGESLQALAEKRYPGNVLMQNRMIAATVLDNLAAFPDGTARSLPPGTRLRLPDPKKIATTPLSRFQAAIRRAQGKDSGTPQRAPSTRSAVKPAFRIKVTGGTQEQEKAKHDTSVEAGKQRLFMESDDSSAALLSLLQRIDEAESQLARLQTMQREMDKKSAALKIAAARSPAPVQKPASENPISWEVGLGGGIAVVAGLAVALFLRRRKASERDKTYGVSQEWKKTGSF